MQEKEVYDYLTAHGVKASVQRVAVMQYLLQQMGHPTVDEIYQALVDHIPTLSKTTVYNTLRLLMEHGVVRMLTSFAISVDVSSILSLPLNFWLLLPPHHRGSLSKLLICTIGEFVPTAWQNKILKSMDIESSRGIFQQDVSVLQLTMRARELILF